MPAAVLIVEDEFLVNEMLFRLLSGWGYRVLRAASAEEALALLKRESADLVLLDNVLAGMTGMQAMSEVRRLSRAKIMLMTGHYDPEFAKDARLLGACEVLAKPLETENLRLALEKALAAGRQA
ncbi:MAG: response regulator [Elusimicrobia bacterium]|nr:response regulator [Elusimicrobiota bacterium]